MRGHRHRGSDGRGTDPDRRGGRAHRPELLRDERSDGAVNPQPGRFRLYADDDVARLRLIRRLKPLDCSIEEMREVLLLLDELEERMHSVGEARPGLLERLVMDREQADQRVGAMHARWSNAAEFAAHLRGQEERLSFPGRIGS